MMTQIINFTKKQKVMVFSAEDFGRLLHDRFANYNSAKESAVELRMNSKTYYGVLLGDIIMLPTQLDALPNSQWTLDEGKEDPDAS
jgi:hypothetical protein